MSSVECDAFGQIACSGEGYGGECNKLCGLDLGGALGLDNCPFDLDCPLDICERFGCNEDGECNPLCGPNATETDLALNECGMDPDCQGGESICGLYCDVDSGCLDGACGFAAGTLLGIENCGRCDAEDLCDSLCNIDDICILSCGVPIGAADGLDECEVDLDCGGPGELCNQYGCDREDGVCNLICGDQVLGVDFGVEGCKTDPDCEICIDLCAEGNGECNADCGTVGEVAGCGLDADCVTCDTFCVEDGVCIADCASDSAEFGACSADPDCESGNVCEEQCSNDDVCIQDCGDELGGELSICDPDPDCSDPCQAFGCSQDGLCNPFCGDQVLGGSFGVSGCDPDPDCFTDNVCEEECGQDDICNADCGETEELGLCEDPDCVLEQICQVRCLEVGCNPDCGFPGTEVEDCLPDGDCEETVSPTSASADVNGDEEAFDVKLLVLAVLLAIIASASVGALLAYRQVKSHLVTLRIAQSAVNSVRDIDYDIPRSALQSDRDNDFN